MAVVQVVSLREIVFEGTLQGTVLLLAQKRVTSSERTPGPLFGTGAEASAVQIVDLDGLDALGKYTERPSILPAAVRPLAGEWMHALLTADELHTVDRLVRHPSVPRFGEVANAPVGIVTGANKFFVVDQETVDVFDLGSIARPMLARASLIDGLVYTAADHVHNAAAGRPVYFLDFPDVPKAALPAGMRRYVELGEAEGLHRRYKCRIRDPWYKVPSVWTTDLSLLKRSHRYPRVVVNEAGAYSTDTAYRVSVYPRYAGREHDVAYSFMNTLTLLHAELLGRHYGGGVLELVPSETAALPLPMVAASEKDIQQLDRAVRAGAPVEALLDTTDRVILENRVGVTGEEIQLLRTAYQRLVNRRLRSS